MDNTNYQQTYWEDTEIDLYHKYNNEQELTDFLNFEDDNIG